jgi:hypothetical protein
MKQLTITAIAILFSATTAFAERQSFRDRSETWLQNNASSEETTSGNLRLDAPGGNNNANNATGAIGDSLWLLAGLGIAYGYRTIRKTCEK